MFSDWPGRDWGQAGGLESGPQMVKTLLGVISRLTAWTCHMCRGSAIRESKGRGTLRGPVRSGRGVGMEQTPEVLEWSGAAAEASLTHLCLPIPPSPCRQVPGSWRKDGARPQEQTGKFLLLLGHEDPQTVSGATLDIHST